ncbi:MAG: FGGY family carbohydrate kinase [Bacteroidota bacterium]|nr:FGGY family carbohydrate kinase [Bacteroidota bacterium]
MLLLGIDLGTSSIKVSVVDANTQLEIAATQYPDTENTIISKKPGWAEQSPNLWWEHVQKAIQKLHSKKLYNSEDIQAIGIAYQMHGLVVVNKNHEPLRDSIIWCDNRAISLGEQAFSAIGNEKCLYSLLNSPGNFTASKLAWVKTNEPETYKKIHKVMLPGDFIGMKLTGNISTSIPALSEGVFWDFKENSISSDLLTSFDFSKSLFPEVLPVFSAHGTVSTNVAKTLGLKAGIPITYKAGDQPNNAFSLNVMKPGEVAATAGTSGVIYGVSEKPVLDMAQRINTFAHVNYTQAQKRYGVLLCINGTGIMNRWIKNLLGTDITYQEMNDMARTVPVGSEGLRVLPFGNGAERMLENKLIGAHLKNIDLNKHDKAHIARAVQEGIAFAFRYGLDVMRENGLAPKLIRAGKANLFQSDLFNKTFVNTTQVPIELYESSGSIGAAFGAGIGIKFYASESEAFSKRKALKIIAPENNGPYEAVYQDWKALLENQLQLNH